MRGENPGQDLLSLEERRKFAVRNRAAGLAVALFLFAVMIYIATYARFGA